MTPVRPSALVSGASRGIGYGIATYLAREGWNLTLTARDPDRLGEVQNEFEAIGATVQTVAGEISDDDLLATLAERHETLFGTMNALVLAAGVGSAAPLQGYPMRRFDKQLAVNFRAPMALTSKVLPLLRAGAESDPQRGGRIVALTSLEGVHPEEGLGPYGASKAALISLVKSINLEEGRNGITATAISPGYVDTAMSAWVADRVPPESMIQVRDIVRVVDLVMNLSPTAVVPHVVMNRIGASAYHA